MKQPVPWIRSVSSLIQTPTWARPSLCARCGRYHATWWTGRDRWCKPRPAERGQVITDPDTVEAMGLTGLAAQMRVGAVAGVHIYGGDGS